MSLASNKHNATIPPILRAIFSEHPEEVLKDIHDGFVTLFGMLHDEYQNELDRVAKDLPLDVDKQCDSLNNKA